MFHLILKRLDKEIMIAFFVATLGVSFFLENLVAKLADFRVRSVPALFTTHTYVIEGLYITNSVVVSLAAALIITFGLLAFLNYTEHGQLLRAVAENAMLAKGVGINTGRMTLLAVLIGSFIAVIGGLLYANTRRRRLTRSSPTPSRLRCLPSPSSRGLDRSAARSWSGYSLGSRSRSRCGWAFAAVSTAPSGRT